MVLSVVTNDVSTINVLPIIVITWKSSLLVLCFLLGHR